MDKPPDERPLTGAERAARYRARKAAAMFPQRLVWRSYGDDPLPSAEEALGMSLRAFPSWFLHIECDRCGKERMLNETHVSAGQRNLRLRDLLARARHAGCGGRALKAELMTGVEGVSSCPVRRIVLKSPGRD